MILFVIISIIVFLILVFVSISVIIQKNKNKMVSVTQTCDLYGGQCIDTVKVNCTGNLKSSLCSGPASIKCCVPKICTVYKCLESPGGDRIANNAELTKQNSVSVQASDVNISKVVMHKDAAAAYLDLIKSARKDGIKAPLLAILSGYRSDATQKVLWENKLASLKKLHPDWTTTQLEKEAVKWVARPGFSNHRSGRTMDLKLFASGSGDVSSNEVERMKKTDAWIWLNKNARYFGFYPYTVEPWHWEYNPLCC
jgi:LAS superfamily LD-carboxypeptidase LdcB